MFTQGKWEFWKPKERVAPTGQSPYVIWIMSNSLPIAQVHGAHNEEIKANAHLIAASPQLLGIVKQFVRYCEQWQRANGDFPSGDGRTLILKNAKDALAQAEGLAHPEGRE